MPLSYPPFVSNPRIVAASNNSPTMRSGERGDPVKVIQQALVDLGYAMPRSTTPGGLDGIFGQETAARVRTFQADNNLGADGIVGRNTVTALDHFLTTGGGINPSRRRRVTLHFRSISLTDVPFEQHFSAAQRVYGQYGIDMVFGSGMSLGLSETEARRFEVVNGQCVWDITTGEFAELQGLGPAVPSNHIAVYYVGAFGAPSRNTLRGCGGHRANRPACIIASHGTEWTTAHEIGHVLLTRHFSHTPGGAHHTSRGNLMFSDTGRINVTLPSLTPTQVNQIKASICCI